MLSPTVYLIRAIRRKMNSNAENLKAKTRDHLVEDSVLSYMSMVCRRYQFMWLMLLAIPLSTCSAQTFTNPILASQDPWVTYDNGTYYYSESDCGLGSVCVVSSSTLTGLATATEVGVWNAPAIGPNRGEVWSPEIHKVNGWWYIYYAADNGNNDTHRLFVLKADTSNPLGTYSMANTGAPNGQLTESTNHWAIDPNVFVAADGHLYAVWSCTNNTTAAGPQNTCLARMSDALHTTGSTVVISTPTQAWEKRTAPIQEGPVGLVRNGKTYITYSGSASWTNNDYTVGLLTNTTLNILDAASWTKLGPIFDHHGTAYGTGSVVFVRSVDGTETWNMYHGYDNLSCPAYGCRNVRMQKIYWGSDGTPVLGYPVNPGVALNVPSGERGYIGTGSVLADWGDAYGDAAQGNTVDGKQVGSWTSPNRNTTSSTSLGAGWHQNFSRWNPNYQNYSLIADMRWNQTGTTSTTPKYGVIASYIDANNFYTIWIDIQYNVVATYGEAGGSVYGWQNCPLPSGFSPSAFNRLIFDKVGNEFDISVNGVLLSGGCNYRSIPLLNGQIGLITEDTKADYANVSVVDTY